MFPGSYVTLFNLHVHSWWYDFTCFISVAHLWTGRCDRTSHCWNHDPSSWQSLCQYGYLWLGWTSPVLLQPLCIPRVHLPQQSSYLSSPARPKEGPWYHHYRALLLVYHDWWCVPQVSPAVIGHSFGHTCWPTNIKAADPKNEPARISC